MSVTETSNDRRLGDDASAATPRGTTLSGVEALAQLLVVRRQLDAREGLDTATMVSGYPGSPLGTFDQTLDALGARLDEHRIVHRPGLNEELAAAAVWGSQMGAAVDYDGVDGVAGAWYGKTPGLDRSGDVMRHANAMGAGPNGGVVMFCGDDPTAKSSTLACESQYTFQDACMPVLYPADQQDVVDLGVHAFHLSRYSGAWVGLKVVTSVADGIGIVDLDPDRHTPSAPVGALVAGKPWRHEPQATVGEHPVPNQEALVVEHRLEAAKAYARHNQLDRVVGAGPGAPLGIVCAGKTYRDVVQAFADLGVAVEQLAGAGIRILKLAMTYPIVDETAREFAASVDEVLVIEEKRPFVESQLRGVLHESGSTVGVTGKRDRDGHPLVSQVGELGPTAIAEILVRVRPELAPATGAAASGTTSTSRQLIPLLQLPHRTPGYCSGCPHNRSTVFPDDALVGGGVGCHGIMYFEQRNVGMHSMPPTPMGSEGVPWIGLAPFVSEPHLIQNLGDGTLSHSGTLAIRASVAAGVNVTFKILYNAAVAMTGGQEVMGAMDVPSMTRALEAEGVSKIVVCAEDPTRYGRRARWAKGVEVRGRDDFAEVQERMRSVAGTTVIIYDQQCAAEARRLRKKGLQQDPPRRVLINEAVCEGCGDCSRKSNCLSVLPVDTEFGEKRQIHEPSCNRDYTCLDGDCPSFVTIKADPRSRRGRAASAVTTVARPVLPTGALPEPRPAHVDRRYSIYFTGIGGTGIVTAARIIAVAAESAGFHIGGLDQTGLSQKAGAVVSHLHLATDRDALGSATVSSGHADLYVSGDILQAAGPIHLDKVDPGRTIAVVDRELTPTAAMLQNGEPVPDMAPLERAIVDHVGAERTALVDAKTIADEVFANHLLANVVLLGAAFQLGGLPVTLPVLEDAMRRRGRGGDTWAAFEWGRWAAHDPVAVRGALDAARHGGAGELMDPSPEAIAAAAEVLAGRDVPVELADLVGRRTAQVVDYQDTRLATRFVDLVGAAAASDRAPWTLTRAVVEAWFKLLTYKDEYEVARLHLKFDYDRAARELGIEGPYSVTYHLHPPVLRRLGLSRKLPMGRPYEAAFRVLSRMKRLRGTKLDPFGLDPDRRTERRLIDEYEQLLDEALQSHGWSYDDTVRLAESPMAIKGYGPIKDDAVAEWRRQVAALRRAAVGSPA